MFVSCSNTPSAVCKLTTIVKTVNIFCIIFIFISFRICFSQNTAFNISTSFVFCQVCFPIIKSTIDRLWTPKAHLAEGEGFEPSVRCRTPVFKTGTFNHSVTLPGLIWRRRGDSNSRYRSLRTNDLANRPLQPLGYSSKPGI